MQSHELPMPNKKNPSGISSLHAHNCAAANHEGYQKPKTNNAIMMNEEKVNQMGAMRRCRL